MTAHRSDPEGRGSAVGARPGHVADRLEAQAYCGPAHSHQWLVDPQAGPAVETFIPADDGERVCYRLILNPMTLRPARDHRGRYMYMPVRYQPAAGRHIPSSPVRGPHRSAVPTRACTTFRDARESHMP